MSEETKTFQIRSSALSDRGLNERRPLNEDAFLHDRERSIFAVADGVGGAEAGEVASQTAIEVLDNSRLERLVVGVLAARRRERSEQKRHREAPLNGLLPELPHRTRLPRHVS